MKLTLGFSPCPNDTFIFDALVNKKIDTGEFDFNVVIADIETLNQGVFEERLDITKLSFPAFFQNTGKYVLLDAGAALGKGVGPLLISKMSTPDTEASSLHIQEKIKEEIKKGTIALPGLHTTANLLFSFAFPGAGQKKFMIFSAIEDAVLKGETDYGVIIHENRFTYQLKGLKKLMDLGEFWEEKMNLPIPLGGIVIRKNIDNSIAQKINSLIRESLEFAFAGYPRISDYVKQHAQEMSEKVMRQHIELYVNNYSLGLGPEGKKAIESLYKVFARLQINKEKVPLSSNMFIS